MIQFAVGRTLVAHEFAGCLCALQAVKKQPAPRARMFNLRAAAPVRPDGAGLSAPPNPAAFSRVPDIRALRF